MPARLASCSCGQLRLTCEGEPLRVSICHCLECQKRTGSVFAVQARFPRDRVTVEGHAAQWTRRGDSGTAASFHFCATCGSTVYWEPEAMPDVLYVAVGAFADPGFPPPQVSVYEERRHPWALVAGELPLEREF
ncbi:MAG: GFA family protein [Sphingomonas sp.]|uniref:GFA family protein n=1 Tax=Sphingomonas sp. TaxID=28214 RepID=UPI001B0CFF0E|nr:GFA family protein [Sphingomonas sp.]MBO9624562.1 GFA family protein [Sphingomonas sp.]